MGADYHLYGTCDWQSSLDDVSDPASIITCALAIQLATQKALRIEAIHPYEESYSTALLDATSHSKGIELPSDFTGLPEAVS